jgi:hypothetical protein
VKKAKLADHKDVSSVQVESPPEPKPDPKDDRIGIHIRLTVEQWRTITDLKTRTRRSLQSLGIEGLNKVLESHGLGPL